MESDITISHEKSCKNTPVGCVLVEKPCVILELQSMFPDLDSTPFCNNDITTPDVSITDELESEFSNTPDKLQSVHGTVGRPSTKIFTQNKVYLYNSLPMINQGNKLLKKSRRKSISKVVISLQTTLNPNASSFIPRAGYGAATLLRGIRIENVENIVIGHLNINSLRNKFQALVDLVLGNLDILVIGETKLDHTFPDEQFRIKGYKKPYRRDRNCNGGGVMIYVREDIPSMQLKKHNFTSAVEAIFVVTTTTIFVVTTTMAGIYGYSKRQ